MNRVDSAKLDRTTGHGQGNAADGDAVWRKGLLGRAERVEWGLRLETSPASWCAVHALRLE